jgi:hypothetical protein
MRRFNMKNFFATGMTAATMALLLGASQLMQAQSGVPEEASASKVDAPLVSTVNCTPTPKVSWAATNGNETASTTSTSFVDLPGMSVSFNVPGTAVTCLKIDLAAMTYAPGGELMFMRVLVDGNEALPGEPQWSGDDDENGNGKWARSHAANFYITVAPGFHNVRAQFRSLGGGSVFAHARSISVNHK